MNLGIQDVIKNGNGNTLIYTALLSGAIANTLPTPFDGIYFRRVNELRIAYDNKKITAEKMETSIALEYYLWTSLWYVALFGGLYAFGGKYHYNARILLLLTGGGLVIGSVQKNIQRTKEIEALKNK